ncbi:hypothetical protein KYB31_09390 [Clostridium felsineum]|uniref:hypothetical protein n=1 Tax=Clostridium felsineum TaxID=36839 RepID=UPI00214D91BC|nr:hypothetical protein [Clostridium felsineum]MCR3759202.1 hypothetical protein [Clostridium felsineum]
MTLLEKAFEAEKEPIKKERIVEAYCPYDYGLGLDLDSQTVKLNEYTDATGCRGITCKECWGKEIE